MFYVLCALLLDCVLLVGFGDFGYTFVLFCLVVLFKCLVWFTWFDYLGLVVLVFVADL